MPAKHETWMPLYIADYLGDTMHLTAEQHGAYLLLLMVAWKRGGHVPDDDTQLAAITRTGERWQPHCAGIVRAFFAHRDGLLWHGRVLAELEAARENVEKKARAGSAGAAARWQKDGNRIADALRPQSQTDAPSPSPSPISTADAVERGAKKRATRRCPEDFALTEPMREWAVENAPAVDVDLATAKFADHTFKTAITDWPAAWRNWLRREQEMAQAKPRHQAAPMRETFKERDARLARERWEQATGRRSHDPMTIDITPPAGALEFLK
jgi:uncharacterized protein YdaU (DUF1376 family)